MKNETLEYSIRGGSMMLNDDLLERTNALAYFKDGGIDAYEMDGSIFIRVLDMEIQISTAEIGYRSDLYMERVNEFQYPKEDV